MTQRVFLLLMMPMCRMGWWWWRWRKRSDRKLMCPALFHGMYWGHAWRLWAEFGTGNLRDTKQDCLLLHHEGRCTRKTTELNCFICSSLLTVSRDWPALSWFRKWWVELFWWQQNEHIFEVGLYSVAFLSSHTKMGLMIISWLAAVICSRRMRRWNLGPYTLRCFSQFGLPCQYLSTALRTHFSDRLSSVLAVDCVSK